MRVMYIGIIRGYMIHRQEILTKKEEFSQKIEKKQQFSLHLFFIILIHDQSFQTKSFGHYKFYSLSKL